MGNVVQKMQGSLFANDWLIGVAAVITAVIFLAAVAATRYVRATLPDWIAKNERPAAEQGQYLMTWLYNLLTTLVSVFPLLGMFGTVWALLGLDLSGGELIAARARFFDALTSTAWGIVFAVLFKLLTAFFLTTAVEQCQERVEKFFGDTPPAVQAPVPADDADEDAP